VLGLGLGLELDLCLMLTLILTPTLTLILTLKGRRFKDRLLQSIAKDLWSRKSSGDILFMALVLVRSIPIPNSIPYSNPNFKPNSIPNLNPNFIPDLNP
jgi:hypothetical protein